jgi:hypothetical protein
MQNGLIPSKDLQFPSIQSNYERLVLRKLIHVQKHIAAKNIFVEIIKPLFDLPIPSDKKENELFCRPDFLLKTSDKTLVIEVMGSDENTYIERKTGTHALMRLIGSLITFDANEAQKQNIWEEKLNIMVKQIYAFFLK